MENQKQKLKQALAERIVQRIKKPGWPVAAVLIPISYHDAEHYILFTRRTQAVKYHKGEMSFPGGLYEERDVTLVNTALRESFEEIGLATSDVEVAGQLDDIVTMTSNFIVSPFVAFIPSLYQFKLNTKEAEALVEIPVSALLRKGCMRELEEAMAGDKMVKQYDYVYQGTVITGATARILKQLLDIFCQVMEKAEAQK